jgi:hypothetical protein
MLICCQRTKAGNATPANKVPKKIVTFTIVLVIISCLTLKIFQLFSFSFCKLNKKQKIFLAIIDS